MAAAVSSVANGGTLWEPRAVGAIIENGRRTPVRPRRIRTTITSGTAARLTGIMEAVIERGTGTRARIPGYSVAGKTGTAAKLVEGRNGKLAYSHTEYNASFIGFVPSRDPVLTIVVVVDSPSSGVPYAGSTHTGGAVAAPLFKRIAEASLRHLGVAPDVDAPPPVLVERVEPPPDGPTLEPASVSQVLMVDSASELTTLPDFSGLSAREVVRVLTRIGMTARLSGEGFVVDQHPAPGSPVEVGAACDIRLARRLSAAEDTGP
jgi:cell division protein FtsI (penicillin-binding protein 3)